MPDSGFKRIHPLTIVVELGRAVRQFGAALVLFGIAYLSGGGGDTTELALSGLGLLAVGSAVARYLVYGYRVESGVLTIRDGIVVKKKRTIPLDRIQNINLSRSLLHRWLGLSDLQIETAGGSEPEARLSALTQEAAKVLREELMAGRSPTEPAQSEANEEERASLYKATPREIFFAGATENRALAIIAGVMGLTAFGGQDRLFDLIEDRLPMFESMDWRFWAFAGLALFLIGWLVSIITAYVQYWNFTLRFQGRDLHRSYGLLNQIENIVPIRRVQIVRITQSPIQRMLRFAKMYVETAGSLASGVGSSGQQQQSAGGSVIAPLLNWTRVPELLTRVLPSGHWPAEGWRKVSPLTVIRRLRVALIGGLVPSVGIALSGHFTEEFPAWYGALAYGAFVGISYVSARLWYATARWNRQEEVLIEQQGVFGKVAKVAPVDKIQSLTVRQSPIQRRLGLLTVSFRAASFSQNSEVQVEDLPEEEGLRMAEGLHEQNRILAWRNPDGF